MPVIANGAASRVPVLLLMTTSIVWGCTWIPLKYFATTGLDGAPLMLVAYGSVSLLLMAALMVKSWRQQCVVCGNWRALCGIAVLGGYASIAFNLSVMYGDVVRMMSLFYTLPLWAVLGGVIFLGEKLTARRVLAVFCALVGAWLILGGANILAQPPSWLDALALSAGFAFSMNNIVFRATQSTPIPPKILAMFSGCALMAAGLLLSGMDSWPAAVSSPMLLLGCAFGVCWLLLANIGTQWSVTRLQAGRAAVIIILELVTAVLSSMWLNREMLSVVEWCGAALILTAAWLEARS